MFDELKIEENNGKASHPDSRHSNRLFNNEINHGATADAYQSNIYEFNKKVMSTQLSGIGKSSKMLTDNNQFGRSAGGAIDMPSDIKANRKSNEELKEYISNHMHDNVSR